MEGSTSTCGCSTDVCVCVRVRVRTTGRELAHVYDTYPLRVCVYVCVCGERVRNRRGEKHSRTSGANFLSFTTRTNSYAPRYVGLFWHAVGLFWHIVGGFFWHKIGLVWHMYACVRACIVVLGGFQAPRVRQP